MKSFCISLEKHKASWPDLKQYFISNGITDISIVPAINGKDIGKYYETNKPEVLGPNESAVVNKLGGVEKMISSWGLYHLVNKMNRRDHVQLSSWGAVGCYLSHVGIWQKILDNNLDAAIVFEDDVDFRSNFKEDFPKMLANLPADGDVYFLDLTMNFKPLKYNDFFDRVTGLFWGTHGYIMTKQGAQKLLPFIFPMETQIDAFIGFGAFLNRVKVYTAKDLCGQKIHVSSIQVPCMICDIDDKKINSFKFLTKTFIYVFLFVIVFLLLFMLLSNRQK